MKRGEIIIVEYPFTDQQGSKRRPALVVQSDAVKSPDTIIAAISASAQMSATRVLIDPAKNPAANLRVPCVVRCENLSTVENSMVLGALGNVSKKTMKEVEECLRKVLEL